MAITLSAYLADALNSVRSMGDSERVRTRYDKFRAMGQIAQGAV
jgi:acetyl-CoA carboxylase alpha subunit